ncbi:leucine-rich repeat receptor protein kinase HPCA1-like [Mangifera indica]|uniref:leucine-rich repeat receptor protein kinase HPCA1-like n=1 Tax=Mangifera indica TaxID=29780 RepID=UPI001CFB0B70|nr:leucine-rich repeat receptor protein kinase HPCA1-like [Mangifera indica]
MAFLSRLFIFIALLSVHVHFIFSVTDNGDAAVLKSLKDSWQNTPPSWQNSSDPCTSWHGVSCQSSRVAALELTSMGLVGNLTGDIGGLTELQSLDLSFNEGLTGSIPQQIGDLQKLEILVLAGCNFSGIIPEEIGNLTELSFLALFSNFFSGAIPPSLGKLSRLYWLDLADNQLSGTIPVSTQNSLGLDLLKNVKHFHLEKNHLSGSIPPQLFSSDMALFNIFLDGNQLTGTIPSTLGLVHTLKVLQLDGNALTGQVPSSLNNLTSLNKLNLANNNLTGPFPDLSLMKNLNYVDLSNNSFDPSEAPAWFSTLSSLTTLIVEHGSLQGLVPAQLFSFPYIYQVRLRNNSFNGTLDLAGEIGSFLQLIDLENNQISALALSAGNQNSNYTLNLAGNPLCTQSLSNVSFCRGLQQVGKPYSTSLAQCGGKSCPSDEKLSPQNCECAYPYEGEMSFRAPSLRDLSNVTLFHSLEMSLWVQLGLNPGSVFLQNPFFNTEAYLQVQVALFPSVGLYFNRPEVGRIGLQFANQTYKPPLEFGPYFFVASPYHFPGY